MAEEEGSHRRKMEEKVIKESFTQETLGKVLSFVIILVVLITSFYLILNEKPVEGFMTLLGTSFMYVGLIFLNRKVTDQDNTSEK